MIYVLAIFVPFLAMMMRGKMMQGIICLVLQCTLIGWLPATIWAFMVIMNTDAERRHREVLGAMQKA